MDGIDAELARAQGERRKLEEALAAGAPMAVSAVTFDKDLYGGGGSGPDRFAGYDTSIPASEDDAPEDEPSSANPAARRLASYTGHALAAADDIPRSDEDGVPAKRSQRIIDREDDYRRRRLDRIISPQRHDHFAAAEATPDPSARTYGDAMRESKVQQEKEHLLREIAKKKREEEERAKEKKAAAPEQPPPPAVTTKRRNRWDQSQDGDAAAIAKKAKTASDWDAPDATPGIGRWDATPGRVGDATTPSVRRNRWDETPTPGRMADADATPAAGGITPGATPSGAWDATPKLPWWWACHADSQEAEVAVG
ncbi:hypothetical protein ACQ4PT_018591 [Festuca glaucescens]